MLSSRLTQAPLLRRVRWMLREPPGRSCLHWLACPLSSKTTSTQKTFQRPVVRPAFKASSRTTTRWCCNVCWPQEPSYSARPTCTSLRSAPQQLTSHPLQDFVETRMTRLVWSGSSSGGTGAAIAARMSPAGLGTDTGGSVRIPAALNGIAGLRPSVGNEGAERRYDGTGVLPLSHTRDTVGPMGRTLEDVALLDAIITGTDVPAARALSGLRCGVPPTYWDVVDNEVLQIMNTAKAKLQTAGVTFVSIDLPTIRELGAKVGFTVVLHEASLEIPGYLAANGGSEITLLKSPQGLRAPASRLVLLTSARRTRQPLTLTR